MCDRAERGGRFVWLSSNGRLRPQLLPKDSVGGRSKLDTVVAQHIITAEAGITMGALEALYLAPTHIGEIFEPWEPLPKILMPTPSEEIVQ